ncbi:DUF929 family protein [Candidatus Parvarchaeota archaeon]|nr:DUF929 family protein [Candidatus Parvarchaeota archaeon]
MPDEDKEHNANPAGNENINKDLQPEKATTIDNNSENTSNQQQNPQDKTEESKVDTSSNSNDDELERLKKENERLKEIQRLREENEKLKGSSSSPLQKVQGNSNKSFLPFIVIGLAVIVVILLILVFVLRISPSSSVSSLTPSINANASGSFFLGPDGQSLGPTYINGLSDLSSQLAKVGAQQAAGSFIYEKAGVGNSGPSPGFYVLVYDNGSNYDIVPITVPSNFSNYSISQGGKPTFVYIGAQGCPFCAGMRWAIAIALSRFGNFSKLFYDRSATSDANVPTLMFNFSSSIFKESTAQPAIGGGQAPYGDANPEPFVTGAYYTSKYINFEPLDEMGGSFLINTTGIEQINPVIYSDVYVLGMHDFNSTSSNILSGAGFGIQNFFVGGVPFFDINNKYVFDGASINAGTYLSSTGVLNPAYSTHQDILNSIENPTPSSLGETELGAANILTAQICSVINNTAPVCSLSYISELESKIISLGYLNEYCLSGSCKIVS